MKNFKLILLSLFTFSILLTSCDEENVDPVLLDGDSELLDLVFFASTDDDPVFKGNKDYKISLIEVSELPEVISNYVVNNYEQATILKAVSHDESGTYGLLIELTDGSKVGLHFDAEGNFVAEKTKAYKGTGLSEADLPAAITEYIQANFPNASIKGARKSENGKIGIIVQLEDETHKGLLFSKDGLLEGEWQLKQRRKRGR